MQQLPEEAIMALPRPSAFLLAATVLAIVTIGMVGAMRGARHGPVYAVATLRVQLERDPRAWAGRMAWVRAIAEVCRLPMDGPGSPCRERQPVLVDDLAGSEIGVLPLEGVRVSSLWSALGRLPLIGRLVPPPPAVRWGSMATYRVQVQRLPCPRPAGGACFAALVLADAV